MSENQQKKKRQHYVPKFILRNFSTNKRTVSVYVFRSQKKILGASLKEQCYADYFYGVSGNVEEVFSSMEGNISKVLGDLSPEHISAMDSKNLHDLKQYIHFQRARTMAAAEEVNSVNNDLMRNVFAKFIEKNKHLDPELAQIKPSDLDEISLKVDNPQRMILRNAACCAPIVSDLEVRFFINTTKQGFIISDNPVVFYNQWAENHRKFRHYPGIVGLACKGLQAFMPISPQVCIALFDPTTYAYGKIGIRTCQLSDLDVHRLNALQALNAFNCIYFMDDLTSDKEIEAFHGQRESFLNRRTTRVKDIRVLEHGVPLDDMVGIRSNELRVGAKFSFIRVIDRNLYRDYNMVVLPIRSPALFAFTEAYRDRLERSTDDLVETHDL